MNSAEWDKLLSLAYTLTNASDTGATLRGLSTDQTIFAIYDDPLIVEMMVAAIGRLCDLKGLSLMRVDIKDGQPSFVISMGVSMAHAKLRLVQHLQQQQQQQDDELGLD